MDKIDTGGPAFPTLTDDRYFHGMDLRDYFAAKALQGLIASSDDPFLISDMAKSAYAMADAMLKARG